MLIPYPHPLLLAPPSLARSHYLSISFFDVPHLVLICHSLGLELESTDFVGGRHRTRSRVNSGPRPGGVGIDVRGYVLMVEQEITSEKLFHKRLRGARVTPGTA
jgi:hypothetical protein